MVRLHLLGFTQDLKGVVFSERKGGKAATFWVPVDTDFLDAIDKLDRARRGEPDGPGVKGRKSQAKLSARAKREAAPERPLPPVGRSVSSSRIPASEIQQLLREGRTIKAVVDASKASRAWVERLFEPVLAERIGVIRLAQRGVMSRPRLGRSGLPVGDAVRRNLEERRATVDTIEGLDDDWDARQMHSGLWRVWVRFAHRAKRRTAEWDFRKDTREIRPRNRLAAQLGWWPSEPGAEPTSEVVEPLEGEEEGAEAKPKRRRAPRRARPKRPKGRKGHKARKPSRKARPATRRNARRPARRS